MATKPAPSRPYKAIISAVLAAAAALTAYATDLPHWVVIVVAVVVAGLATFQTPAD